MLLEWIIKNRINDYSDVVGLLVTAVGFFFTLLGLWRSRKIAFQALDIANKVREDLRKVDVVDALSRIMMSMEEIKRLHRRRDTEGLPERYSAIRRTIIGVRSSGVFFTEDDQTFFQGLITHLAAFERKVEISLNKNTEKSLDFIKMNKIISESNDRIHDVLMTIKSRIGDGK